MAPILRALVLQPIVVVGLLVVLAPAGAWLVQRRLAQADVDRVPRLIGALVAVSLLAGVLALVPVHLRSVVGDRMRLDALQSTRIGDVVPAGSRLLAVSEHLSPYRGIDSYTISIDGRDAPQPTSFTRLLRVETSLPGVVAELEQVARSTGWDLVGATCAEVWPFDTRQYQRRLSGFRATVEISWVTTQSAVFPGTAMSNVQVLLEAPSVYTDDPLISLSPKPECLTPPVAAPPPPQPPGVCAATEAQLGVVVAEATTPLSFQPVRKLDPDLIAPRWARTPAGEPETRHLASEPRTLLEEHGAVEGWASRDDRARSRRPGPDPQALTSAYEFPSHEAARAFHADAVARACAQGIEAFVVPGVADAVGVRVYVPATGMSCRERSDHLWGFSSFPCEGQNWVIDYVAFVRGQYHLSVAVGDAEERPPELDTQRTIALDLAAEAARAACEVEVSAGARRSCTSRR